MLNGGGVVESARRGDIFAFQSIVERYQTAIYRYLYRLVADSDQARDLTIATFLAAHKSLKSVESDLRFEAWLHRLATRAAGSALLRRRLVGLVRKPKPAAASREDDPDAQDMQRLISALPAGAAVSLLLWSLGGFSYEEIAHILRVPTARVRSRIAAAREGLRRSGARQTTAAASHSDAQGARVQMLLSPHLDRQTTSEERVAVEQHLAGCAACQGILSSYQQIDRRLARLRSRGPSLAVAYDVTRILRGDKPAPSQAKGNGRRRMLVGLVGVTSVALIACMSGLLLTRRGAGHSAGMLYVALQNNEGQVAVVDAQDSRLVNTISVGARPTRLAVTRDGARLYALLDSGLIAVIDTTQGIVTDRYLVGGRLNGMALAPDGKILYVTIPDRRVVLAIDAETGRSDGEMRVGRTPREIAVTPDGQWLVVYNSGDNTLSRIRVSAKQEAKVYRLFRERDGLTDFSLHPLALTPDGRKVYVCEVNRERIWSVDLVTDEVLSFEVPLRDLGRDLAVSTGGDRLFVTHGDARGSRAALAGLASMALPKVERNAEIRGFFNAVALNPDGTTLYATNQDENSVIFADVRTLQTLATVPVGIRPAAIVYAPKPRSP